MSNDIDVDLRVINNDLKVIMFSEIYCNLFRNC